MMSVGLSACVATEFEPLDPELSDTRSLIELTEQYQNEPLEFELSDSQMDMCFSNPEERSADLGYGVDLITAKWMAFFSGNVYAHHLRGAVVLDALGFGDEGEADQWWAGAADIFWRELEIHGQGRVPERLTIAKETQAIAQTPVAGKKMQFFTAGKINYNETYNFERSSTQFVWAEHRTEPVVIIAFRGTESSAGADILADIAIDQEPLRNYGEVHSGFLDAYGHVVNILTQKLKAESGRGLKVWITGHSLGAALANLAAISVMQQIEAEEARGLVQSQRFELKSVYTFGMPRIGDPDFKQAIEQKFEQHDVLAMRFRHGTDRVTSHPMSVPFVHDYVQTGRLMHMTGTGGFDYDPDDIDPGITFPAVGYLSDHLVKYYYQRINKHLLFPSLENMQRRCDVDGRTRI